MEQIYEFYEEGSWDLWEWTIIAHINRMSKDDLGAYLPSPVEIEERKQQVSWLFEIFTSRKLVHDIMQHDHPGIGLVVKMVDKHGPDAAEKILIQFLAEQSYDIEKD